MSELKPCPFCGGKASINYYEHNTHSVECNICHARTSVTGGIKRCIDECNARSGVWINIEEQLPKIGQECLIEIPVCERFNVESGKYKGNGVWVGAWCSERGNGCCYKVSRWMPR